MNIETIRKQLPLLPKRILRYKLWVFAAALVIIYGFIIVRTDMLANAKPNQSAVASQANTSLPTINPAIISKINQLQDNSVSVQALFDQARQNPFAE